MLTSRLKGASSAPAPAGLVFVGGFADINSSTQTPSNTLTSLTGGIASAPASGDIVIACISMRNGTDRNIQCTTSGYTELADIFSPDVASCQLGVYFKVLSTAETSVAFDLGVNDLSQFCCHVWRNVNNSTPIDATTTTAELPNTGVPDAPSITTVTNNAVVIAVGSGNSSDNNPADPYTVPSGMENFFQALDVPENGIAIASIYRPTAGAYNPPAFGGGIVFSNFAAAAATIALRPE
jgi:hypothetical protein